MLPTSSAFRSNVSAAMIDPPRLGDRIPPGRGAPRVPRGAPNVGGYGGPFEAPHLNNRPGVAIGAPFTRESAGLSQPPRPRDEDVALLLVQQLRERGGRPLFHESSQVVAHAVGQRLAREIPDHRAQLGLDVETETVVDGPDAAVGSEQAVAALAVGVVGDQVEDADAREPVAVRGLLAEREVVLLEVRLHELLQRALAVGSLAPYRERHQPPAERLRQVVRGQLALEEAGGKIPERALAALGLVDGERARPVERDLDEEGRVAAARQASSQRHLTAREDGRDVRRWRRGRCSAGTRGRPGLSTGCTSDRWTGPPSPATPRPRRRPALARA